MKQSKITTRKIELVSYEIRVSEAQIVIESKSKDWQVKYASTSPYYDRLLMFISDNRLDALSVLVDSLYSHNIVIVESTGFIIQSQLDILTKYAEMQKDNLSSDEKCAEDLEHVKSLHKEIEIEEECIS